MVIKCSGKKLGRETLQEVAELKAQNHVRNLIVVHGGGVQIDARSRQAGIEPKTHMGYRITCSSVMEIVAACMQETGLEVHRILEGAGAQVELFSSRVFRAKSMGEPWKRYGAITKVDYLGVANAVLNEKIALVSPVGWDSKGLLNLDADECAASIAVAVRATQVLLVTDVNGIVLDGNTLRKVSTSQLRELLDTHHITNGMIPKTRACIHATENGVAVKIVNGDIFGAINYRNGKISGTVALSDDMHANW